MPTTMEVEKARFYYEMRNTVVIVECSYERQPPLKYFDINDKEQSSYAKLVDRFASKEKTDVLTERFGGVFIDQQGYVLKLLMPSLCISKRLLCGHLRKANICQQS